MSTKTKARRTGQRSRRKGAREELLVRDVVRQVDPDASRVPLSGAGGGRFSGDVRFDLGGEDWSIECKLRGRGFARLYDWLGGNDILTVRADNKPRLWVMPEETAIELLRVYAESMEERPVKGIKPDPSS